jgi:hypothetical protein
MGVLKIPVELKGLTYREMTDFDTVGAGSLVRVRARNIKFAPTKSIHFAEYQKSESGRAPDVGSPGADGGQLTFEIPLRGGAGAASEFMKLAKQIGTYNNSPAGHGAVAGAGTTSSTVELGTGEAASYAVGDAIMINTAGGASDPQIRFISQIDTTTDILTIEPNWATTPSNADQTLAIDTLNSNSLAGEPTKYLEFIFYSGEGTTDMAKYTLDGCAGNWKIQNATPDAIPYAEFTFNVDRWTADSPAALAAAADGFSAAHPLLASPMYRDNTLTATESFEFDPAINIVPFVDAAGSDGRQGWVAVNHEPKPKIKPYHDKDWVDGWLAGTEYQLFLESIKDTDDGWAVYFPQVQQLTQAESDIQGLASLDIDLSVNDPGTGGSGAGAATAANIPVWAIAVTSV